MISKGKNAIITGASGGMGQLLCKKFAQEGVNLAICSVDEELLEKQASELKESYKISVIAKKVDATNESEVKDFIDAAAEKLDLSMEDHEAPASRSSWRMIAAGFTPLDRMACSSGISPQNRTT